MKGCRPLADREISLLLESGFIGRFANRNRALFALGVSTGFRISGLLSLKIENILSKKDSIKGYVYLERKFIKGNAAGQTKKVYPFAQQALQFYIDELREKRLLDPELPLFFLI